MSKNAVTYLRENKKLYSREVLVQQLRAAGYGETDISDSVTEVFENDNSGVINIPKLQAQGKIGFWDFSKRVNYDENPSLRLKDFLLGLLAPFSLVILFQILPLAGLAIIPLLVLLGAIIVSIILFNRRRYISYGLILNLIAFAGLVFYFILNFSNSHF